MVENIEDLTSPPVIGNTYLVPTVNGVLTLGNSLGYHSYGDFAVFLPSHEDSKYYYFKGKYENDESIPGYIHHYHVDPRFHLDIGHLNQNTINVIVELKVKYFKMVCVRGMPPTKLFKVFGPKFIDDHHGKKLKCMRCPHKGVNLSSVPVIDGTITCPAHGLVFDTETKECIS